MFTPQGADFTAAEMLLDGGPRPILRVDHTTGFASLLPDEEAERVVHLLRAREQRLTALLRRP